MMHEQDVTLFRGVWRDHSCSSVLKFLTNICLCVTAVAVLSLDNSTYSVSEESGGVLICVVLAGQTDRNISVRLLTVELTGQTNSASQADFNNTVSVPYTFLPGSAAVRTSCASIPIARDGIVESVELFQVTLLENPEEEDVLIDVDQAEVFITDSPSDSESISC